MQLHKNLKKVKRKEEEGISLNTKVLTFLIKFYCNIVLRYWSYNIKISLFYNNKTFFYYYNWKKVIQAHVPYTI